MFRCKIAGIHCDTKSSIDPMSEFPHDDFAKDYLTELLSNIGTAVPNKVIKSERREGDIWFERNPKLTIAAQRKKLGLMGQLLRRDSLIEVFRNPATIMEIRACRGKLTDIEGDMARAAKRKEETLTEEMLPDLWFIMPTASEEIRQGFGVRKSRIPGVYRWPKFDRTGLIVVHQLPVTEETLWIRLLGRSGNQERAIQELVTQPVRSSLYNSIEDILANYRAKLERSRSLTPDEEELIMNLSVAYLKKQEEWKEEGKLEAAIGLLREGVAPQIISRALGLPIATIEKLRDQV
jgi:hypothetical protein